ncbi:FxSxx-COOH system tetratricopeptide repeat protein [Actinomadura scrupuli]|uniref:FxSxx-COOH system tetratricopeptide repeat protein n=1 Tax=Actinomadura scrupuli TaxID=559629 RepID=UPI003D974CF8
MEELADALWLARRLPSYGTVIEETETTGAQGSEPDTVAEPPPAEPPGAHRGTLGEIAAPAVAIAQATLHIAPQSSAAPNLVRSPAVPAIPRALSLARALRPLRVAASSRTVRYLNEEATAQRIAETRIWQPEMWPAPERWLDLALVVDDSASMIVWHRTVSELQAVLEQLAAFRDVRVWRVNTDDEKLVLRTGAVAGGSGRSPDELIDPTHRRVVLVFSDCIGRAWGDGRAASLLERWAKAGPVAIVQPLPQRLWWRCGFAVEAVRIKAAQAGLPNDRLVVRARNEAETPPGVAIPVMELEPRWVRPWAELVGGGSRQIDGMAMFTGLPVAKAPEDDNAVDLTPMERVSRFRAGSSPTAFRLAGYLAAAPLRLPVMRLVQHAMIPESTSAHLAEVFLSDLLKKADPVAGSDDVAYEFHDGVRDVLLGSLHRGEAMAVLRRVWEVIRGRWGSALDFPALLKAVQHGDEDLRQDPPFAQVAARVLARLGGRYAEIAERLASQSAAGPDGAAPPREGALPPGPDQEDTGQDARRDADESADDTVAVDEEARTHGGPVFGGGLPPRNPVFTGRDDLLRAVRERLTDAVTALVPHGPHGLGGQGKSQLAVEYAYRYSGDYDLVWWIPAEQITLARSSLALLARQLGTPLSDDINRTVEHVLDALRSGRPYRRWLLIYDNATDPDELVPLMPISAGSPADRLTTPVPTGHVLITSRDRRWARQAITNEVGVFERPESTALLRRRVPRLTAAEADRLADRLGDLPLAVEQAAAWQAETGSSPEEYLSLLDHRLQDESDENLPADYPAELAATLGLAFERLREESPAAGRLLELWAFFGPEPVSEGLLSAGAEAQLPAPLKELLADGDLLRQAMRDINRYALGRFDPEAVSLQVHRLVRTILQAGLSAEEHRLVQDRVHRILAAATPSAPPDDETTWGRRAEIAPHVVLAGVIGGSTTDVRGVALDQMRYLYFLGDFEGSRVLGEIALARWREDLGPDDGSVLRAGWELGNVLRALGDLAAAGALNAEILRHTNDRFGPDHLVTMLTARSVGADLRLRGDFTEALRLDQDTMRRMLRMFGRDHVETLRTANNVGIGLRLLGEFRQAYEIDADSLERLKGRLGEVNRNTLLAMNQVARDLHGLGRYHEAATLQRDGLESMHRSLGPDHAFVLHAEMSHSVTLRRQGAYDEARSMAEDTFRLHLRRFGENHPDTLAARRGLAMACVVTGDLERARQLSEAALTGYRRVMGINHPFVHACAADYALTLRALGGHEAARVVDDAALGALHHSLGADHYYSLCCSVGLVHDLYRMGRLEAAHSRSREVLERFRARYGADHVYTLACSHNHRVISRALDREDTSPDPVAALRLILGRDHPEARAAAEGRLLECVIEPIPL